MPLMCFMLYAGTSKLLPRKDWNKDAPDLCVRPLTENEIAIQNHFASPELQFIGSTSSCGCNFPFQGLTRDTPVEYQVIEEEDPDAKAEQDYCRGALVEMLRKSGERVVELYGIWAGAEEEPILFREDIALDKILAPDFRFKEQGFYRVTLP